MRNNIKQVLRFSERACWFFGATTVLGAAMCGASALALMTGPIWMPIVAIKQASDQT